MRVILIAAILLLTACQTTHNIETIEVNKPTLDLPHPEPIMLDDIEWVVLNQEKINKLSEQGDDVVLFGITPEDYENLSLNLIKIKNYIIELKKSNRYYREYYESHKP